MAAGDTYTIFRPRIMVAPVGSVLPALPSPTATNPNPEVVWPSSWLRIKRTGNGAQITVNAPMQDIVSDEVGLIGVVSAGTENVAIAWQTRTPDMSIVQKLAHFLKTSVAANATATPPVPAHDIYKLEAGSQPFMVGIEGNIQKNALTVGGGKVLAFGYNVMQTENTQLAFRTTGNDSIVQPSANVRCLPTTLDPTQVPASTALAISNLDEKFNLIVLPAPTS